MHAWRSASIEALVEIADSFGGSFDSHLLMHQCLNFWRILIHELASATSPTNTTTLSLRWAIANISKANEPHLKLWFYVRWSAFRWSAQMTKLACVVLYGVWDLLGPKILSFNLSTTPFSTMSHHGQDYGQVPKEKEAKPSGGTCIHGLNLIACVEE